jgi:hypothetical protein
LILTTPAGRIFAETLDDDMEEEMELLERQQKILAKIVCTPGIKTYEEGEEKMCVEDSNKLAWPINSPPPFYVRV